MVVRELQESFKNHPDEKYRKIFVANYHPGFVVSEFPDVIVLAYPNYLENYDL